MTYLEWLSRETPGCWWVDTGVLEEIRSAGGALGVTMNPLLLARGLADSDSGTRAIVAGGGPLPERGSRRAVEITRRLASAVARDFHSLYESSEGEDGYVCAQVDPALSGDEGAMVSQAREFASWAPNVLVKLPMTEAGVAALEQCTAWGINITATVSFSLAQVVAAAEAHARGTHDAKAAGRSPGRCYAVAMLGRLDDHLKRVAANVDGAVIDWAGIAVAKRARKLFSDREYEARLLPSGMRHVGHVGELAGGAYVYSISPSVAREINDRELPRELRVDIDVDDEVVDQLRTIPDFVRAFEPDGMEVHEFAGYGASQFTLNQFAEEGWQVLADYEPN